MLPHPEPDTARARRSTRPRSGRLILAALSALALAPAVGRAQAPNPARPGGTGVGAAVSSGQTGLDGVNINTLLGADSLYNAGYTGTRSIVANIEGGHIWNGHETLTHVNTFIDGPGSLADTSGTAAAYDMHATWVGQMIGGRGTQDYQKGIAYGATLWSGSIASQWTGQPFTTQFNWNTYQTFIQPYNTALVTGVGGQKADVVNSSWGFSGDPAGRDIATMGVDALARSSGKTIVFAAGNSGPNGGTVWGPASGYNTISVGALYTNYNDTPDVAYTTVWDGSSRGGQAVFKPTAALGSGTSSGGSLVPFESRTRVDIVAPGYGLTLAQYTGTTGGNTGGTDPSPGATDKYNLGLAGTSFAAPAVAAGAALLVDVAKDQGLAMGSDGRVAKAVLMNSADKLPGWSNAQTTLGDGTVSTTQAVDRNLGAGRMNLAAAYAYYGSPTSTRDVAGTASGNLGAVAGVGWDYGVVTTAQHNFYLVDHAVTAGTKLTVTLTWFANRSINSSLDYTSLQDNSLANLDMTVWAVDANGNRTHPVGWSHTHYDTVEHLYFDAPADGRYEIDVGIANYQWNFSGDTSEAYAVAWNFAPVPEPAGVLAVAAVAGLGLLRLRRTRSARRDAGLAA